MNYKRVTAVVFLYGILGCIHSQEGVPSSDDVLQTISENANIPELKNFNASALPGTEEVKSFFREKCIKNGAPEAYENAQRAQEDVKQCLSSFLNWSTLQAEIEKYKPTGDLDIVFKNYCQKSPTLKKCMDNFTSALEPCLDEKEREGKRIVKNITDSLLAFACYKEGDRIALFISSGGPECFQSKQQVIQDCVNSTMSGYIPTPDPNSSDLSGLQSLQSLSFGPKECNDISNLQTCIVRELEKCQDPTPANVVDSIFNFIMKATPCDAHAKSQAAKDAHSSGVTLFSSFLLMVTATVLLKFA